MLQSRATVNIYMLQLSSYQFTVADMIPLRGELKREMGSFRIDVKRSDDDEGIALVATNTPKT